MALIDSSTLDHFDRAPIMARRQPETLFPHSRQLWIEILGFKPNKHLKDAIDITANVLGDGSSALVKFQAYADLWKYTLSNYPVRRGLVHPVPRPEPVLERPVHRATFRCFVCGNEMDQAAFICRTPVCFATLCSKGCMNRHAMVCPRVPESTNQPRLRKTFLITAFYKAKYHRSLLLHLGAALLAIFVVFVFYGNGKESVGLLQQQLLS